MTFLLLESTAGRSLPAAIPRNPWSVFLAAGTRIPQQEAVRKIYGTIQIPLQFGLQFRFSKRWAMDAGLTYLDAGGQTRIVGSELADENYRTRLTLGSFHLGVKHQWLLKRLRLSAGAGGGWNFYREKWPDAGILQKGMAPGFGPLSGANTRSPPVFFYWAKSNIHPFRPDADRYFKKRSTSAAGSCCWESRFICK